jgi:hypothetical protein
MMPPAFCTGNSLFFLYSVKKLHKNITYTAAKQQVFVPSSVSIENVYLPKCLCRIISTPLIASIIGLLGQWCILLKITLVSSFSLHRRIVRNFEIRTRKLRKCSTLYCFVQNLNNFSCQWMWSFQNLMRSLKVSERKTDVDEYFVYIFAYCLFKESFNIQIIEQLMKWWLMTNEKSNPRRPRRGGWWCPRTGNRALVHRS